jgi:hypothetical protein
MRMLDKDFECKALRVPLANVSDAEFAVSKVRPSVGANELDELRKFAHEFGETIDQFNEESTPESEVAEFVGDMWNKISMQSEKSWLDKAVDGVVNSVQFVMRKTSLIAS